MVLGKIAILRSVFLVLLVAGYGEGARILCISPQGGSHMLMMHSLAEGLVDRGHDVHTVISDHVPIPQGIEARGFKVVRYHTPEQSMTRTSDLGTVAMINTILENGDQDFHFFSKLAAAECIDMDNDNNLYKQLLELKIDLAIVDVYPLSYCLTFMPIKLNIPFVLTTAFLDPEMTRAPALPSFIPYWTTLFDNDMSLSQRIENTILTFFYSYPTLNRLPSMADVKLLDKYNRDSSVGTWNELTHKAQLVFVSRGPVLEYPMPLMPNVINVECLTCRPAKPLPNHIETMVKNANGVIVVSFGSVVDDLPDHVTNKLIKAFAKRTELIIWRYGGKLPEDIPSNIKLIKWLPQNDLLGHPRTRLFITHAGNNGQYESVYHGVPMLAFPLFGEQPHNGARIVKHGFGLVINFHSFTSMEVEEKMFEIIENPSYRERTQRAGRILKSKDMNATQTAAYWMEHVLEFGGEHLMSHALDMPWYSFYMVDILGIIMAVICGSICLIIFCCSFILKRFSFSSNKEKQD